MKSFEKCLKNAKNELDEKQCERLFKKLSSDFEKLPADVLLSEVLPKLDIVDLVSVCSTSKKMRNACYDHDKSPYLWLKILKRDFGIELTKKELNKLKLKEKKGFLEVYKNTLLLSHKLKTDKSLKTLNEILDYGIINDNMLIFKIGLERMTKNNVSKILLTKYVEKDMKYIKLLLESGADVNIQNKYGATALIRASVWGKTGVVSILLESGADVDIQENDGNTALMSAAYDGQSKIVSLLLESGADVNIQDIDRQTALIWAAINGKTKIVSLLLESDADVNIQDIDGDTALKWATRENHAEIVKMLKKYQKK